MAQVIFKVTVFLQTCLCEVMAHVIWEPVHSHSLSVTFTGKLNTNFHKNPALVARHRQWPSFQGFCAVVAYPALKVTICWQRHRKNHTSLQLWNWNHEANCEESENIKLTALRPTLASKSLGHIKEEDFFFLSLIFLYLQSRQQSWPLGMSLAWPLALWLLVFSFLASFSFFSMSLSCSGIWKARVNITIWCFKKGYH